MSTPRPISLETARRLAVASQYLDSPRRTMLETIRQLGCLQLDPIKAVIQSHFLVLWSRLGEYDLTELDTLMWQDRALFEYWAHCASIVLTENMPIHRHQMAYYRQREKRNEWVLENEELRDYVLKTLQQSGATPLKALEGNEKVTLDWHSSGWTSGRNVDRMIDYLWTSGEVLVAGRQKGGFRVWDIAERVLPNWTPVHTLSPEEMVSQALKIALKALGVGTPKHINYHFVRGHYPEMKTHLNALERSGEIVRAAVLDGTTPLKGDWYVQDVALLERIEAGEWQPRSTLLSPFDNLICDRGRTEQLFNFFYRIEIYTPKHKRQYGYYVLPFLEGDRLIGRIDPHYDRKAKTLHVNAVYWETPPTDEQRHALQASIESLARWLGAQQITQAHF